MQVSRVSAKYLAILEVISWDLGKGSSPSQIGSKIASLWLVSVAMLCGLSTVGDYLSIDPFSFDEDDLALHGEYAG